MLLKGGLAGLVFGLLAFAVLAPPAALAQELPPAVAAVIDYQRILQQARAARSMREQIEARRETYQAEIEREEERLRNAEQAFAEQRAELTSDAQAERRRQFEQEVVEVQRMVQERRRALDRASAIALNQVKEALIAIVTGIAEEKGFNIVLSSSDVLFFDRSIDLTEDVLADLDARLPDVRVPEVGE
jgi:Skp family chaperone for outer membrane proteins